MNESSMPLRLGPISPENYLKDPRERFADAFKLAYKVDYSTLAAMIYLNPLNARPQMTAVVGSQYGDEGKGRVVDNIDDHFIKEQLASGLERVGFEPEIVSVVHRVSGGENAGHSHHIEDYGTIGLHHIPSGVLHKQTMGIMHSGMIINPEDVMTEIDLLEEYPFVGDLAGRLILSEDAIIATDVERALEPFNAVINHGKSSGGTRMGMSPAAAGALDRTGTRVRDLMTDNWEETYREQYRQCKITYEAFAPHYNNPNSDEKPKIPALRDVLVPDFEARKRGEKGKLRPVGDENDFIERLRQARNKIKEFDERTHEKLGWGGFVQNTFPYLDRVIRDKDIQHIFELSQGISLDPWIGNWPDVASTSTTPNGIISGIQHPLYSAERTNVKMGVIKGPYMSKVGSSRAGTDAGLSRDHLTEEQIAAIEDPGQRAMARMRTAMLESGTSTGRNRDMAYLDLELLMANLSATNLNSLAVTHMDAATEDMEIKICTHYENAKHERVPYQLGGMNYEGLTPIYETISGWDGEAAKNAKTFEELPVNAQRFLLFLEAYTGLPVLYFSNKRDREGYVVVEG